MTQPLTIRQIYLKDLSFQAPSGASIFVQDWAPQVKIDMKAGHSRLPENLTEVVLTLSVVGTNAGTTAFMIEVLQAGIFELPALEGADLEQILLGRCPAILLPYAREAIDATLMKARFPALILAPIDFEANWRSLKA